MTGSVIAAIALALSACGSNPALDEPQNRPALAGAPAVPSQARTGPVPVAPLPTGAAELRASPSPVEADPSSVSAVIPAGTDVSADASSAPAVIREAASPTAPAVSAMAKVTPAERQAVVRDSIAAYLATGHPCACPYNTARNGSTCGRRSAYSRPGGAAPLCYPADVTDEMVFDWRRTHTNP
jgi:hypothetical protein